jgi:hypothetical protein
MKSLILLITLLSTPLFATDDDCDSACYKNIASEFSSPFFQALTNIKNLSGSAYPETMANDPRLVRSSSSPKWLAAVGRSVSKVSTKIEQQCSLSIIADAPGKDGIIAITAGHCVAHWASSNGENGFSVAHNQSTFTTNSGKKIKRSIEKVLHAETNLGDYAIVKLNAPIKHSDIKPLLEAPMTFDDLLDEENNTENFKPFATMAGFSGDKEKGQKGKVMTYHEKCLLNGGTSGKKKGYCTAYNGASGGAVVVTAKIVDYLTDETWQENEQSYFVGSIRSIEAGDDFDKTLFTPTTHYTKVLNKILASH